jgi:hypothetical protein
MVQTAHGATRSLDRPATETVSTSLASKPVVTVSPGLTSKHEECGFLCWASEPRTMVCQWFGLKNTGTVYQWFDLKTTETVCQWFDLKTTRMVSPGLASKPVVEGFLICASKPAATI